MLLPSNTEKSSICLLYVIHQGFSRQLLFFSGPGLPHHLLERDRIEDSGDRVADLPHHDARSAMLDVGAIVAGAVRGFAGARQRSERAFHQPNDQPDRDLRGRLTELVPAAWPLLALHNAPARSEERRVG